MKRKQLAHQVFVYAVYDKVSDTTLTVFNCDSDSVAVRQSVQIFVQQYPIKDLELRYIGILDSSSSQVHAIKPVIISWTLYQFPETRAESLAPLGLSKDDFDKLTALDLYKKLKSSESRQQVEQVLEQIKLEETKLEVKSNE